MMRSRPAARDQFVANATRERQVGDRRVQVTELSSSHPELDAAESVWMRRHSGPLTDRGGDSVEERHSFARLVCIHCSTPAYSTHPAEHRCETVRLLCIRTAEGARLATPSASEEGLMKKSIWTGMLAATVGLAGAGLAGQTGTTPQQSTPQTTTAGSDQKVTVTGCLRSAAEATTADATGATGTTAATGTAGATGTSGSADSDAKYILADASLKPADTSGASTSPDTPASTSPSPSTTTAGSGQTYRLIANPAALTPHVGKKLELTGTLVEDNASASPNGAAASSAAQGPALRVESGKVVGNSCSQ
jgi:hypothetical protein